MDRRIKVRRNDRICCGMKTNISLPLILIVSHELATSGHDSGGLDYRTGKAHILMSSDLTFQSKRVTLTSEEMCVCQICF